MLANKLRAATAAAGGVEPVGIDFDGTNDYLSRSSDLVGNADGKTFTVSLWQYTGVTGSDAQVYRIEQGGSLRGFVFVRGSGELRVGFYNSGGSQILNFQTNSSEDFAFNTWTHYLLSVDMTDQAATKCYKNDEAVTFTQSVFTNDNIDFTCDEHLVKSGNGSSGDTVPQRLAGVYLDYTYRDLSVEANRRDFIDADGRYVTPPTTGIISVPMDDPDDPGRNDGTGGDFTLNGVVAQAGRGPNQYNASASYFNTGDSLANSSLPGITSTGYTVSCLFKGDLTNQAVPFWVDTATSVQIQLSVLNTGVLRIYAYDRATTTVLINITADAALVAGRWYSLQAIFDPVTEANNKLYVDGIEVATTTNTFVSRASHNLSDNARVGPHVGVEVSDVWFADTKVNLSSSNPFYDTETGKPKYLGANGELPIGSAPLIYLPLRADDAGSNKGTGGDFTVNSGPYTGARGPSEFWAGSAEFNGSSQYLQRSASLAGISNGKQFSFACSFLANSDNDVIFSINSTGVTSEELEIRLGGSGQFQVIGRNLSNSTILNYSTSSIYNNSQWYTVLVSVDMASAVSIYIDGSQPTFGTSTRTNDNLVLDGDKLTIGREISNAGGYWNGKIGFLWFDTTYIDFSQEANRLKFFDAFNNPVDLGEDGSLPTGSQPLIYMNNDFHLGTNLGSGGNFTPQNTPTDGGYVKG